ncbi:MAG: RidA family protein [Paracoccaceae bacterium]
MSITRIKTGARMSQAAIHNGTVYLAGQVGNPGEDAAAQTRTILAGIDALLSQAGSSKEHILQATIWLSSMDDFAAMNAEWDAWVPAGHAPARATGESALATPDYLVEIIIIAAQADA